MKRWLIALLTLMVIEKVNALTYDLPGDGATVIGAMKESASVPGDTLVSVARRYDLGYVELLEANPTIKASDELDDKQRLVLPTEFILPDAAHQGLVINVAELRLYFYKPGTRQVISFPVGIGRQGWNTPLGQTSVVRKQQDPTWHVSSTIKKARLLDGVVLPDQVPPGPENPLGGHAVYLGFTSILMHGSNDPSGIGRRSSSGCIRLQPEAIESIYDDIALRSSVMIVDQPVKVGWRDNTLYVEVHEPLQDEQGQHNHDLMADMRHLVERATASRPATVDWAAAEMAVRDQLGYPIKIGEGTGAVPLVAVPLNPEAVINATKPKKNTAAKPAKAKTKSKPVHHSAFFHKPHFLTGV